MIRRTYYWPFGGTLLVEVEVRQEVTACRVAGDQVVEVGTGSNGEHVVSSWDILFKLIGKIKGGAGGLLLQFVREFFLQL